MKPVLLHEKLIKLITGVIWTKIQNHETGKGNPRQSHPYVQNPASPGAPSRSLIQALFSCSMSNAPKVIRAQPLHLCLITSRVTIPGSSMEIIFFKSIRSIDPFLPAHP